MLPKEFKRIKSKQDVSNLTKQPLQKLNQIVTNKKKYYYSFERPKKSGGVRTITPPNDELKSIQNSIKKVFDDIKWPSYVQGGVKGRSILKNANKHVGKKMLANLDVKDFFPTTSTQMIKKSLVGYGMNEAVAHLISEICTFDNALPQGAPTSTLLANLAFLNIDKRFNKLCKKNRLTYSRYVDDISISGERELITFKGEFIKILQQGGYHVATNKIDFVGRNKPQTVNNILVNDKLRPSRKFISELKKEIRMCWKENLGISVVADLQGMNKDQLTKNLWGRINFIHQFDKKKAREVRALMTKIKN